MAIMQLIEDRHAKSSTIITSQLPINKWYDYLAEPTLGDAIMDRILQHANRIELKGQSMRVRMNMQQNPV
ncbi:ATP-binding protein, partial [Dyadobacter psychrotolerans]